MEKIASFTINHMNLFPGVYVSRKDNINGNVITTFDIRITRPNFEPVMNAAEMHTIEHLGATFWVFRYTYGRFWRYLLVNLTLDGAYIFLWYPIQINLGMASGWLPSTTTYVMMIGVSLLIYVYQMWQEEDLLK